MSSDNVSSTHNMASDAALSLWPPGAVVQRRSPTLSNSYILSNSNARDSSSVERGARRATSSKYGHKSEPCLVRSRLEATASHETSKSHVICVTLSVSRYVFLRGKQAGQLPRSPPNSFLSGMAGVSNNTPHSKKEHIVRRTEQRCSYPGIIIPIKKKKLREITELDSRKIASIHSNCFHGAQLVSNHCQQLGQATIVTISCTRHPSKRRIGHTMP